VHRGHHNDTTHHGWRLQQPEPGRYLWTSPAAHTYQVDPDIVGLLTPPTTEEPPADADPPPF
jgi:hypothetical protein